MLAELVRREVGQWGELRREGSGDFLGVGSGDFLEVMMFQLGFKERCGYNDYLHLQMGYQRHREVDLPQVR